MTQPLTSTTLAGLRPTGVGGRRVVELWEQIDTFLRNGAGADLADLFAEPALQPNGSVLWFGRDGAATSFARLDPDAQAALRQKLADRLDRLDRVVRDLAAAPGEAERQMGEVLAHAVHIPSPVEAALFSVDGEPVLVNWSMDAEGAAPDIAPLREFVRPPAPPPPPAEAPPPPVVADTVPVVPPPPEAGTLEPTRRRPAPWWLLWLLLPLLLGAILYLLLIGCAIDRDGRLANFCPAPAAPAPPDPEAARTASLLADIAALEQQLAQSRTCPPPPQPPREARPAPAREPTPPPDTSEFDRRQEERGAHQGDTTITLIWNSPSDLDLVVLCPPDGQEAVFFHHRQGCGGTLDTDANANAPRPRPIENIFFVRDEARPGAYVVQVFNFRKRTPGQGKDSFQVRIKQGDQQRTYSGAVGNREVAQIDVIEIR